MNIFKKHRVVMATIGSLGDLHPYIALALEMKKRFIEPVIATSNAYRQRIESLGIEFRPIRPEWPEPETPEYLEMMAGVIDPNRGAEYLFKGMLVPAVRDMYDDLNAAIVGADMLVTIPSSLLDHHSHRRHAFPGSRLNSRPHRCGPRSIRGYHQTRPGFIPCLKPVAQWRRGFT